MASFAHAAAPPGRYTVTAEVVTDTSTGLHWQRSVDANTYTQTRALSYCPGLTLAGETVWRLPTLQELLSIVDSAEVGPAIDPSAFPGTQPTFFWTASPDVSSGSPPGVGPARNGWAVNFYTGGRFSPPVSETFPARCVR